MSESFLIFITAIPEEGANYQVAKTASNENWDVFSETVLELGVNTKVVGKVSFAGAVKFQFSNGETEFTSAILNGARLSCAAEPSSDTNKNGVSDIDLNGSINGSDLLLFLSVFGSDC